LVPKKRPLQARQINELGCNYPDYPFLKRQGLRSANISLSPDFERICMLMENANSG